MNQVVQIATHWAVDEFFAGRSVCVIVPAQTYWMQEFNPLRQLILDGADGIYIRASSSRSSLLSIRVDTLIIVEPDLCVREGLRDARYMTHLSRSPKILRISDDYI